MVHDPQRGRCLGFLNRELAEASGVAVALPPSEESTSTLDNLGTERHLSIVSMFVRQEQPSRAVDLFAMVGILGREADCGDGVCGFHFILPDTLRASTGAVRGGLTMFDVEVCPWSPGMRGIAAVFYRVRRGRRTDRLLHSVKNLVDGQEALRATSAAYGLTASVLERIDLLRQTGDAEILLGGSLALADRMAGVGAGYAALVETGLPEPLAIANRQLVLTHSGDTKPVRNASHVVFTIGGRPDSLSVRRYIEEQQREHARSREKQKSGVRAESYLSYLEREAARRRKVASGKLYGDQTTRLKDVTPITLVMSQDLVESLISPGDEQDYPFRSKLEAMCEKIRDEIGVKVPDPLRVGGPDMVSRSYLIEIGEVPLVRRTLPKGDAGDDMIHRLDGVLRRHLPELFGIDEVVAAIESCDADGAAEILARIHAQHGGVVRFRECLLQLLDEGLPCRPIDELARRYVDICGGSEGGRPTHEIADELRRLESINGVLTRDVSDWSLHPLDEDVTRQVLQHIRQDGQLSYLALPEELTGDILRAVRVRIDQHSGTGKQVILVQDWRVRRFVRRIVEQLSPLVKVVAEEEIAAIEPRPRMGPCISVA